MIMDIDHFKSQRHLGASGWRSGDKTVVNIIGKSIRPDDLLARRRRRVCVLLTDIDTERAKALAERIQGKC